MDATGEPFIIVSALVKGTGTDTMTNINDNFLVDTSIGSTLVASM
ncbi:hypothetical protein [Bacteroides oleiciplenus]|nr:hypothetical protein [Bacteroides oleiciplenus]